MKRHAIPIVLALTLCIALLSACGSNGNVASGTTGPAQNNPTQAISGGQTITTTPTPTPNPTPEPTPKVIETSYPISRIYEYSEGKASVAYYVEENGRHNEHYGVVDETGHLLFETENILSKFLGGFAYCATENGFIIMDETGKISFDDAEPDDRTKKIASQGENIFLIIERVSNFSENEKYFYAIDGYGNMLSEKYSLVFHPVSI